MALKPFETLSQNYRNLQRTRESTYAFLKGKTYLPQILLLAY